MGPTALRPIRRTKQWLSVLLKDTSVTAGDSNPHSADQKHQSLNSLHSMTWFHRKRGDSRTKELKTSNAVLALDSFVFLHPHIFSCSYGECLVRGTKESPHKDSEKLMYVYKNVFPNGLFLV